MVVELAFWVNYFFKIYADVIYFLLLLLSQDPSLSGSGFCNATESCSLHDCMYSARPENAFPGSYAVNRGALYSFEGTGQIF